MNAPCVPARPLPRFRGTLLAFIGCLMIFAGLLATQAQAAPGEPVRITFWHAMGGHRQQALDGLIKQFNQENPGIVVEGKLFDGYNQLNNGILGSVAQRTPPDVAQVYENWTTQLIEVNALVPVGEYANGKEGLSKESLGDLVPAFLAACKYRGQLWTLPFNKSLYVMYCNMDAFAQAGVEPPRTWDEFLQVSRKLTVQTPQPRVAFAYRTNVDMFSILVAAFGGSLLDSTNTQPAFQSETGKRAASFLVDLVQKEHVAVNSFEDLKDFLAGRSAIYIETTSRKPAIDKGAKFRYDVRPLPSGTRKPYLFAGTNVALFRTSPERQAASWRFMKWLVKKESTLAWAMATDYVPVRKSAIESAEYQAFLRKDPRNAVALRVLPEAVAQNPPAPAWQSIRGMLEDRLFLAAAGKVPATAALDDVAENAKRLLQAFGP